jgi:hypothetical protein
MDIQSSWYIAHIVWPSAIARFGEGNSVRYPCDGMQQGITESITYCFAGEAFISEDFMKMRDIR